MCGSRRKRRCVLWKCGAARAWIGLGRTVLHPPGQEPQDRTRGLCQPNGDYPPIFQQGFLNIPKAQKGTNSRAFSPSLWNRRARLNRPRSNCSLIVRGGDSDG
jgi:hypothetical protein